MLIIFFYLFIIIIIYDKSISLNRKFNKCKTFNSYCVKRIITSKIVKYSIISRTVIYDTINFHINFISKYNIQDHYYIALDRESYHTIKEYTSNILIYFININNSNNIDFGSSNYRKIVISKTKIGNSLLHLKREILLIDIDIYFFYNPIKYVLNHTEDLIITLDGYNEVNTGF